MGSTAGIATAAGGIATAYSQQQTGVINGKVANWNAHVADVQAKDALARGEISTTNIEEQTKQLIGAQNTSFAAQGVQVGTGSSADVAASTYALSDRDVSQTRMNAAREAWGFKVQAADARFRGDVARRQGTQEALGTLMTTGARGADLYSRNQGGMTVPAKKTSGPV